MTDWTTGREYRRVSIDRAGERRSVDEQGDDNHRAAQTHQIRLVGEPYVDNDRSASRYATKKRDDFERLLADLESGAFGAEVLVLWESSRGSRKVGEWVSLIDLLEAGAHRVFVTTHGRIYDPANGRDRRTLLEDAVDSEYDSYKTRVRILRDTASQAAKGRPHGLAPYGYRPLYDERTRRLITWEAHPDEAPAVRELFEKIRAGDSLKGIARELAQKGVLNRGLRGERHPFTAEHLRDMAVKYAYAGKRHYNGSVIEGTWEGLVDDATFYVVQRILNDPKRKTTRPGGARHVLSRALRCDPCSGPMAVKEKYDKLHYFCQLRGCTHVDKADVDAFLLGAPERPGVILRYIASPQIYRDFAKSPGDEEKATQLGAEIARLRVEKDKAEKAEDESTDLDESRALAKLVKNLREKITNLEEQERQMAVPAVLRDFLKPDQDVFQRWEAAPLSAKREVAQLLLVPSVLGEARVKRGRLVPAEERIVWKRG